MALLNEELAVLVTRRHHVAPFAEQGEQARQQLGTLDDLAIWEAGRLDKMTLEERKEVMALLDVGSGCWTSRRLRHCGSAAPWPTSVLPRIQTTGNGHGRPRSYKSRE